ncbi:MAG: lipoprotein-releasing ABC transporter permease subunit [Deltaproteobacteria bacterium]|nr:lipoprotein-releasing ABC transporter permease subunit [Deltaproteobacteria bacterium]
MAVEYFIGRRYLRTKQKQAFISLVTFLSIAGVTVGVMALIVVIAVMAGFEADMKDRILNVDSHVVLQRHMTPFTDYKHVMTVVQDTEGVESATPFVLSQIMLRSASGVSAALLRGVDPDTVTRVSRRLDASALKDHAHVRRTDTSILPGIILGKDLAARLAVLPGDTIHLISPRGMLSPIGHMPTMKRFAIVGLFESGMHEYDVALSFVDLADAQRLTRMKDSVTGIDIRVTDIYHAGKVRERLVASLGFPYWGKDWMQKNQNLFSALKLEQTAMFVILMLIVLVAALNIASSLIMMVMEKKKDIAILRTMGSTDKQIRRIFVFKGMIIGVIGTALGICLGLVLCALLERYHFIELPGNVYYPTTLPVLLRWLDVVKIAVAAMGICYMATLYPARQASRLDPIEAIRNA